MSEEKKDINELKINELAQVAGGASGVELHQKKYDTDELVYPGFVKGHEHIEYPN